MESLKPILTLSSPAKINLFLHITGQRQNGYHELQSLFQYIHLYDTLSFSCCDNNNSNLYLDDVKNIENNLITQAYNILRPYADPDHFQPLKIKLIKRIPMGAGLGGGSSNAATTFLALNTLWHCKLSIPQLKQLALPLGADIPFFLSGNSAWIEGIGEKITPLKLPEQPILLFYPKAHHKTHAFFQNPKLKRNAPILPVPSHYDALALPSKFHTLIDDSKTFNAFESLAEHETPIIKKLLQYLKPLGTARMTGTGSCCFFLNDKWSHDVRNFEKLKKNTDNLFKSVDSMILKTLNCSPVQIEMVSQLK